MKRYPVENLLREPTEYYSAVSFFSLAFLAFLVPHAMFLTEGMGRYAAVSLGIFGTLRAWQGYKVRRYQKRLMKMPYYGLSTREVPASKEDLFLGRGFLWTSNHTQRLHQIKQVKNLKFITISRTYRYARAIAKKYPLTPIGRMLNSSHWLNPFKKLPPVKGKPYLHGLGNEDKPICLEQDVRVGHTFVLGTTRVGKTRLASILINQDIRNGDAVIVVDPKGDLDLVRDMYSACLSSNRLDDFKIVHLGFPEVSASYNPLKNFDQITEVATRITDAINADGEGQQFADFAWKYVNVVVNALYALCEPITYKEIAFYITRLDQLLMRYCDKVLVKTDVNYSMGVTEIIAENDSRVDKFGNPYPPMERSKAVLKYVKAYVSNIIQQGNIKTFQGNLLIELFDAASLDKQYYDKITASVGPVLAKINSSNATDIFSSTREGADIELMNIIKNKKILYIGLDSLSNATVATDVGKAFLSDLVSTAGKIYKEPNAKYTLNFHCDELSEIIQESFVKILNKAGGAGFQVTAYAQTKQDLEVALGSRAMAEMTEGNLNTLIMLRVKNTDTAKVLTDMLPAVDVVSHTQVSMVNDTPHGEDNVYFNTTNEDRVQMTSIPMLEPSDLVSLPKGQAFVLANGGDLYKIRIPLPINDGLAPDDIVSAMRELNFKNQLKTGQAVTDNEQNNAVTELSPATSDNPEMLLEQDKGLSISQEHINRIDEMEENRVTHQEAQSISEDENRPAQETMAANVSIIAPEEQKETGDADESRLVADFTSWLEKRMHSNNRSYKPESQKLIKTSKEFGMGMVFVTEEVLIKYQSRSGIDKDVLSTALKTVLKSKDYFLSEGYESQSLYPVKVSTLMDCTTTSMIEVKGE